MYNRDWKKIELYIENQVLGFSVHLPPPLSEAGLAEFTPSSSF